MNSNSEIVPERSVLVLAKDLSKIITIMTKGRSLGHDDQSIEHFGYAGEYLPRILAMVF